MYHSVALICILKEEALNTDGVAETVDNDYEEDGNVRSEDTGKGK